MTKEITKAFVLQEMQDKLGLREWIPEKFLFSENVIPTYNIEQHLQFWGSYWHQMTVTETGGVNITRVPADERWKLRAYTVTFISGSYTVAGVYIVRETRKSGDMSYLDLTAAQSTAYLRTLPESVILEHNDYLYVCIDGYTVSGDIRVDLDFMREKIR